MKQYGTAIFLKGRKKEKEMGQYQHIIWIVFELHEISCLYINKNKSKKWNVCGVAN